MRISRIPLRCMVAAATAACSILAHAQMAERYRLIEGGDEVLDVETQLVWRRCAIGMTHRDGRCVGTPSPVWSVEQALAAAPARATAWRLPTVQELMSIVLRPDVHDGAPVVDVLAFPDTPRDRFLAASLPGDSASLMHHVDFARGKPGATRPLVRPARLVRDLSPR